MDILTPLEITLEAVKISFPSAIVLCNFLCCVTFAKTLQADSAFPVAYVVMSIAVFILHREKFSC